MEDFANVNWLAVGVGTIVSFIGAWIWYSPKIFGTKWANGSGVTIDSESKPEIYALVIQFVALLILATVIGITATTDALFTALLTILAATMFVASSGAFSNKSTAAIVIESGYVIVVGIIMIIFQGVL